MLPPNLNLKPAINAGSRSWGCHHFDVAKKFYLRKCVNGV